MTINGIKASLRDRWRWQSIREALLIAAVITVIISVFDIKLDPMMMLRTVASNYITCLSISFCTMTVIGIFGDIRLGRAWQQLVVLVLLLAFAGMLGGLLSWWLNDLFFPYNISHPLLYMAVVATLTIVFGLSILGYHKVSDKLDQTVSRLAEKEVAEQKLLRLKKEAELESLRARVNPHFLFNTLNAVASLIPSDPLRAEDVVQKMSNLFHYVLMSGDRESVRLAEELDIIDQYLQIEQVRLGPRLQYLINRGSVPGSTLLPGMLLQPLVENAVKYGIAPCRNGGSIEVLCRSDNGQCRILITDTGPGFDPAQTTEGFGLAGVRQRLALHYPDLHKFEIISGQGNETSIQLTFPLVRAD